MENVLEQYLNTVDRKLRPLPVSERVDIVKEIKSAMQEMEAEGLAPDAITKRLGAPEQLARAYLSDLLTKPQRSGWQKLLTVLAFYSVVGLSGMFVIPILGICAPAFFLCAVVVPLAGLANCLFRYLLGVQVPYLTVQLGPYTPPPLLGFVCTLAAGGILFLLGRGCWWLLVRYLKAVGTTKDSLSV